MPLNTPPKNLDTLPERLTPARHQQLTHHEFLELLLADEVTRRDTQSALLRAKPPASTRR